MALSVQKSTANIASKRLYQEIDLETKFKVIKDYKGGKSVMVIAELHYS